MHVTYFKYFIATLLISPYSYSKEEGNILFNDALNTRLYGVSYMVTNKFSDNKEENPLLSLSGLLF